LRPGVLKWTIQKGVNRKDHKSVWWMRVTYYPIGTDEGRYMTDILLTAPRTIMSPYHGKMVFGFASSASRTAVPEPIFQRLFFPKGKCKGGLPREAHIGLRRIESKLLEDGFDVKVVDPDHLSDHIPFAKVLGVHAHDPLGLGPNSITWRSILKGDESYSAKYFRKLMLRPEIRKAKRGGCKIIAGGTGVWQFEVMPEYTNEYGIDCFIEGEAERLISQVCERALDGDDMPKRVCCTPETLPQIGDIPNIRHPTTCGIVEVGRGCPRGCHFCSVTHKKVRWFPLDMIERDFAINKKHGIRNGILMAEDVLLYGSRNVIPDREKVLKLNRLARKYYGEVGWSHITFAAVNADPQLVGDCSEILLTDQDYIAVEMGIETGSTGLVERLMPAKAKPFGPQNWPQIVVDGMGILADNKVIPYNSLILGLPGEREEDVIRTIDLVEELKQFRCLLLPLFFIPLGKLKEEKSFNIDNISDRYEELLIKCFNHDIYHIRHLLGQFLKDRGYSFMVKPLYSKVARMMERKARKSGLLIPGYMPDEIEDVFPGNIRSKIGWTKG
jgi:radical SAM superfamily enzyme YgiQ (UPF0313 family)